MYSPNGSLDAPVWDEENERRVILFDIEMHRPLDAPADIDSDGSLKKRVIMDTIPEESTTTAAPSMLAISVEPSSGTPGRPYTPVARFGHAHASSSCPSKISLFITHVMPKLDVEFKTAAYFGVEMPPSLARVRTFSQSKFQPSFQPICNSWDAARCNVQFSASVVGTELPTRCVRLTVSTDVLQQFHRLAAHLESVKQMGSDAVIRIESRSPLLSLEHIVSFIELCADWTSAAAESVPAVSLFAAAITFGHSKACNFARKRLLEGSGVPMVALPDVLMLSHQANDVEVIGHCYLACTSCTQIVLFSLLSCLIFSLSSAVRFAGHQDLLHSLQWRHRCDSRSSDSCCQRGFGHAHICGTHVSCSFRYFHPLVTFATSRL